MDKFKSDIGCTIILNSNRITYPILRDPEEHFPSCNRDIVFKASAKIWNRYFPINNFLMSDYIRDLAMYEGKILGVYTSVRNGETYYLVTPVKEKNRLYYFIDLGKENWYKIINGDLFEKDDELFKVV